MKIIGFLLCGLVITVSGCALTRTVHYYPEQVLTPALEERVRETFTKLSEPNLYVSDAPTHINCRMTVLPSAPVVVCVTLTKIDTGDVILTTRILSFGGNEASRNNEASRAKDAILFNESHILPQKEWNTFLTRYFNLARTMPTDPPPELLDFFAELGGAAFVLEGWGTGEYRLFPIIDPRKEAFSKEVKAMLARVFPHLDVSAYEAYIHEYAELLKWFEEQTGLSIFDTLPGSRSVGTIEPR
jgi:hypothetical protein